MNENYFPIEFDETGSSFTITNSGTAPAPCKVTFIPKVDFYLLTIEGLTAEPLTISGVRANDVVVIDGESRTVEVNDTNALSRYNAWEFPKLQPGINVIRINNGAQASLQVEYNPRFI